MKSFPLVTLAALLTACLAASPPSNPTLASSIVTIQPAATYEIAKTASPDPTATIDAAQQVVAALRAYGVVVVGTRSISLPMLKQIHNTVNLMAGKSEGLLKEAGVGGLDRQVAFQRMYGSTVIRLDERETIDGINYGVNCGWEGGYAEACQLDSIYPEQEFPTDAWLILLAEPRVLGTDDSEGINLIAHEIAHNLTWGEGHLPLNVEGYSYVFYVGDAFAIDNIDAIGVTAGRDSYYDEAARKSHPKWRSELTADAIASWALDRLVGPYADSVGRYIYGMLLCELTGGDLC